jgi:hypothetical protein
VSEAETLFAALRRPTDDDVVAMLERMVRHAPDHALNKINALDLAAREGVGEERVIAALLNAVGLGTFEMSWNVMCPSCAGVLSANKSLEPSIGPNTVAPSAPRAMRRRSTTWSR